MRYINRHTVYHILVSLAVYMVLDYRMKNFIAAASITLGLGLIKEVYDHIKIQRKNTIVESFIDVLADIAGIALGFAGLKLFS